MDTKDVILFGAIIAFVAFRLYQKYVKKDQKGTANDKSTSADSTFFASSKDDDYEPYSRK
jgi:uncharacterized membrane protein YebE (DUF533 family)